MKRTALKTNPEKVRAWQQRSRKSLNVRTGLRPKSAIRKVGKTGRANIKSRKQIALQAEAMNLKKCEVGKVLKKFGIDSGCTETWPLAPAHRHKRAFYNGDAELLADKKQWVCACQNCHDTIEHDAALTEAVFIELRGEE